jgi:hypothetical protein
MSTGPRKCIRVPWTSKGTERYCGTSDIDGGMVTKANREAESHQNPKIKGKFFRRSPTYMRNSIEAIIIPYHFQHRDSQVSR